MGTQQTKTEQIDTIKTAFSKATSAVVLDYRGLTVKAATDLRNKFRAVGVDYRVVKNTLVKLAVKDTALDTAAFKAMLVGQTAIAWSYEDPSVAAKVVKAFRSDEKLAEKLNVKCGILENIIMAAPRVETELASMPGKNEVRAMLLAQLMAPAQKLVMQLNAPGQNMALVLDARRRQQEGA